MDHSILSRATTATEGKAAKDLSLVGFLEIENCGGSGGASEVVDSMVSLPVKKLLWQPCCQYP
jgi:hypothetical protein